MGEKVMIRKRRRVKDGGGLRGQDMGDETKDVRWSSRGRGRRRETRGGEVSGARSLSDTSRRTERLSSVASLLAQKRV